MSMIDIRDMDAESALTLSKALEKAGVRHEVRVPYRGTYSTYDTRKGTGLELMFTAGQVVKSSSVTLKKGRCEHGTTYWIEGPGLRAYVHTTKLDIVARGA